MPATSEADSLIELLEREIATFDEEPCALLSYQIDAFTSYYTLLREDETSLSKRPKQRRCERQRLRNTLADIFIAIGAEFYVLCTLAVPRSRLVTEKSRELVPKLRLWWKSAPRPSSFILLATELCESYSIGTLISSHREYIALKTAPVNATPDESDSSFSNNQPSGQVLDLKLSDLLSFLQKCEVSNTDLKMRCPYIGIPLPHIELDLESTLGLSGKLQFSLQLSESLIQYMLKPRMRE
ncbi:hypothetical protein MferCBS49748_006203 [Microsporum ferrugineum]